MLVMFLCFMYNMSKIDHQQTLPGYENSTCPFTLTSGLACKTSGNLKPVTHFSFFTIPHNKQDK